MQVELSEEELSELFAAAMPELPEEVPGMFEPEQLVGTKSAALD